MIAEMGEESYREWRRRIGSLGGKKSRGGGFARNPELAKEAGRRGGTISKRRPYWKIQNNG